MSLRQPRDGRPTGVRGTITAQAMKDALGITAKPREVKVADSPAQARLRSEGKDREADALASDDYSAGVLGPSDVYEVWGAPELAAAPGSPDGTPVPLPPPKSEAARQARRADDGVAMNAPSAAELQREAEELQREAQAHVAQARVRAEDAVRAGASEAALDEAKGATSLVAKMRSVFGGE